MGIYNEILSARFAKAIQKLFSMKGQQSTRQVAGEIMPVLPFPWGPENRWLASEERFGGQVQGVAVAAQNSATLLRNPVGSNVIAVVEKISVSANIAFQFNLFMNGPDVDLAGVNANTRIDKRGRLASVLSYSSGNNSARASSGLYVAQVPAATTFDVILTDDQELTILPGDNLEVRTTTVNLVLLCAMIWRERQLEESERQ